MVIFLSHTNNEPAEQQISVVICSIALTYLFVCYLFNIISFLNMIKCQEKQYKISFDDNNSKTLAKYPLWVICSDNWLICPGKYAIHRKDIKSASIGKAQPLKGGIIYPVRVQTLSEKVFKLKFRDETAAKALRNWTKR